MQKRLPNRIRELRLLHNLTQEELADKVGISNVFLSEMERGKRRLSTHWMTKIAPHLKVAPANLLNEEDRRTDAVDGITHLNELYAAATPEQQKAILHVAEAMTGFRGEPAELAKKAG
ncbi:XRE family transcriptional regulator [Sphingomonas sp. BHC-A]|nr:XRE family transcriptional regulator [Sphingomonas sp. BHC-A]